MRHIALHGFQQPRNQAGAHHALIFGQRVENAQLARPRIVFVQTQPTARLFVDEAVIDGFGESHADQQGADPLAVGSRMADGLDDRRDGRKAHGNVVVPGTARDLFHQVLRAADIHAEAGRLNTQGVFIRDLHLERDRFEQSSHLRPVQPGPEQTVGGRNAQDDARGDGRVVLHIDGAADQASAAQLRHQLGGAIQGVEQSLRIDASFETVRRIGRQAELFCGFADAGRRKIGALDQDPRGAGFDFGVQSTHDAAYRHRFLPVADHEHLVGQAALFAVQGHKLFACPGGSNHDPLFGQVVEVESVQGLPGLHQNEIGNIHDVVDGP